MQSEWTIPLIVVVLFIFAFTISRFASNIAVLFLRLSRITSRNERYPFKDSGRKQSLLGGLIQLITFSIVSIVSLVLLTDTASVLWFIGLFSAGFSFAARPLIGDYLTGISLIFEDSFEVGEKIQLPNATGGPVEGVVEAINLRTTSIRARSGEPITVPNGDVRIIKNFSRALYSESNIKIRIHSKDTHKAIDILESMADEAALLLDGLTEPWFVISEDGELGGWTILTLVVRAEFGKGATVRPKLIYLVQERLTAADILLDD